MASKQSPAQQDTIERVMHEFKHGELEGPDAKRIKNPKQAIAIALHEAGATNTETRKVNERNLRRTKRKERVGETAQAQKEGPQPAERSKAELYAEAKRRDIPGRSAMSKADLARALKG